MTDYRPLHFDQDGPTSRIMSERPENANGIDDVIARELADAATRCDSAETEVAIRTATPGFTTCCAAGGVWRSHSASACSAALAN